MSDDRYLIPEPPKPDETQRALHPRERVRANIAIGVALVAALFTGIQAWEAHTARIQAQNAAADQKTAVEIARDAAVSGQKAAESSAAAAWASVGKLADLSGTIGSQVKNAQSNFSLEHTPSIGMDMNGDPYSWFTESSPRADAQKHFQVMAAWKNSGAPATGCVVRSGGKFAKAKEEIQNSDYVPFSGVLDLPTEGYIRVSLSIPPGNARDISAGTERLFMFGKVDCDHPPYTSKRYHSDWCFSYPIRADGSISNLIQGCRNIESASDKK